MKRVFLGGTCNESTWRGKLIPLLDVVGIEYFNPVVPDWTPECQAQEDKVKAEDETICLFVITSQMTGVFSIAEAVDMSNKAPERTLFAFFPEGFSEGQAKSLEAVKRLIENNGAKVASGDFNEIAMELRIMREKRSAGYARKAAV